MMVSIATGLKTNELYNGRREEKPCRTEADLCVHEVSQWWATAIIWGNHSRVGKLLKINHASRDDKKVVPNTSTCGVAKIR